MVHNNNNNNNTNNTNNNSNNNVKLTFRLDVSLFYCGLGFPDLIGKG